MFECNIDQFYANHNFLLNCTAMFIIMRLEVLLIMERKVFVKQKYQNFLKMGDGYVIAARVTWEPIENGTLSALCLRRKKDAKLHGALNFFAIINKGKKIDGIITSHNFHTFTIIIIARFFCQWYLIESYISFIVIILSVLLFFNKRPF